MTNILNQNEINKIAYKVYRNTIKNGGTTIDLNGRSPMGGYAFAPCKETERTISSTAFSSQDVISFMNENRDLLKIRGNYIGSWTSEGKIYLDISRVVRPSPEAIAEGQNNQQYAIYDLSQGKEILIGKRTDIGYAKIGEAQDIYTQYCLGQV